MRQLCRKLQKPGCTTFDEASFCEAKVLFQQFHIRHYCFHGTVWFCFGLLTAVRRSLRFSCGLVEPRTDRHCSAKQVLSLSKNLSAKIQLMMPQGIICAGYHNDIALATLPSRRLSVYLSRARSGICLCQGCHKTTSGGCDQEK